MFVEVDLLYSGASYSHRAGEHAQAGADRLSRGPVLSGMFGDFPAAKTFHGAMSAAHVQHVKRLQAHQEVLTTVGVNAHRAGTGFTEMDGHNAAKLLAVQCNSDT